MSVLSRHTMLQRPLLSVGLSLALMAGIASCTGGDTDAPDTNSSKAPADRRILGERLAGESLRLGDRDPRRSVALALEAAGLAQGPKVTVALNRLRSPHPFTRLALGPAEVSALDYSDDGRFLIGGDTEGRVRVWDTYTGGERLSARAGGAVTEVALSYGGKYAAARSSQGGVQVWDLRRGRIVRTFADAPGRAVGLIFINDVKALAFGGPDGTVQVWGVEPWSRRSTVRPAGGSAAITSFFGQESSVFATVSPRGIIDVWDPADGRRLATTRVPGHRAHTTGPYHLRSGPDDPSVVSTGHDTWAMWLRSLIHEGGMGQEPRLVARSTSPASIVYGTIVAPDPARTRAELWSVTGIHQAGDTKINHLYSASVGSPGHRVTALVVPRQPNSTLSGVGAPPAPLPAALALSDGSVTLWDLSNSPPLSPGTKAAKDALLQLCSATPLILTREEWKQLIPELPYAPACIEVMKKREGELNESP
ncbi:WD40 repeat domain-containing protein [Streptomyces sp. CB03234]|uniref:WD40 repeat domain-containing protein n=1 Tax=Streptomyces sp. (strain CB03234) TaxID=1703937 RepID=UPI00130173AB|nr:hypothetical protein [Streptomyces sp. CB03234]